MAARVDAGASGTTRSEPWERFAVPPLGEDLLTADLLKRKSAKWDALGAFRLVLTPSCDLVKRGCAQPKVGRIPVAQCERPSKLGEIDLTRETVTARERKKLRPFLAQGLADGLVPIPQFKGHVPLMVANLKRLNLLDWGQVAGFERVASTDSPFREVVSWAYPSVAGRPGTPDFDVTDRLAQLVARP